MSENRIRPTIFLEFVALIVLRLGKPDLHRPFRIPLNVGGLVAMTALPSLYLITPLAAALSERSVYTNATLFAIAAVATAPLAWLVLGPEKRPSSQV